MAKPTRYQDVISATNYALTAEDGTPFPLALVFNGSTQFLQTNSIDFSSTDKVLVAAGVRKLSDAALGILMETGIDTTSAGYPGSFAIFVPDAAGAANYRPIFRGDVGRSFETLLTYSAPITNVLAIQMSNQLPAAGKAISSRINGVAVTATESSNITDAGNFGDYPLYIGARAGTSLFFNGRLYSLIIAGIKPTDAQILGVETYINSLTRAF